MFSIYCSRKMYIVIQSYSQQLASCRLALRIFTCLQFWIFFSKWKANKGREGMKVGHHLLDHHIYKLNQMCLDCEEGLEWYTWLVYCRDRGYYMYNCPCVDMNFIFEYITQYLTSEHSEWVRYRVEHLKINFISTSGHIIFCLLYKHQWKRRNLLCNHNNGDLFTCEDKMSVSCVTIWSFCTKAHLVFHWCLYIIKNYILIALYIVLLVF